jgi:hypothetical protein
MASVFTLWPPITGPAGAINGNLVPYSSLQSLGLGTPTGGGAYSLLGTNNWADPGAVAADISGLLMEGSNNQFIGLETSLGGPTAVLLKEA